MKILQKLMISDCLFQIFIEADLDEDNQLSFAEFEHVISKAPDFVEYVNAISFLPTTSACNILTLWC